MSELFSSRMAESIRADYEKNMSLYPIKKEETDQLLKEISLEELRLCFQYLYGFMPVADIVTYSPERILSFAEDALHARNSISYGETVPVELFLAYVLFYRINNENLDDHRQVFYDELFSRVQGKTMKEAILEVNYWCYEKATYIPTDGRTLAPLSVIKTAKGRCGEESTLTVAALRSVGIPARQCYVPRWAHCDDNHAWVEAWADGKWYYLGACEPEPVLNKGWFTAAASKSMLVHSKAFSHYIEEDGNRQESPLFELVNSTKNYGICQKLTAVIKENGIPKPGVSVRFEIINYGELFPMYTGITDEQGRTEFITGMGDIHIHAHTKDAFVTRHVDVRKENMVELDLKDSIVPGSRKGIWETSFDMVPPTERVDESLHVGNEIQENHKRRLEDCEELRQDYEKTFAPANGEDKEYRMLAKGNLSEIDAFLADTSFEMKDKLDLLSTLRKKDFADITRDVLESYLEEALDFKDEWPEEVYRLYLLAPRIEDEMIIGNRLAIRNFFERQGCELKTGAQVWDYIKSHVKLVDEYGCQNLTADNFGILYYGVCGKRNLSTCFVAACRALGIPARINPVNQYPEYAVKDGEDSFHFCPVMEETEKEPRKTLSIKLENGSGKPLKYNTQFTIGVYKEGVYESLNYEDMILDKEEILHLYPGSYRILTASRQIDGSVRAKAYYFNTEDTRSVTITMAPDGTADKLKQVPVPNTSLLSDGKETDLYTACQDNYSMVVFSEPGKEPTEHLFQELLEQKEAYEEAGCQVIILTQKEEQRKNPTLNRVLEELSCAKCYIHEDADYLYQLHLAMQVGDERLPFALVVTPDKKALFAFANYNIGTAETMLSIMKIHRR